MPKYDYKCTQCDFSAVITHSMEETLAGNVCEKCAQGYLRRVFSPPAVTFNGPGFYRTDNR